MPWIEPLRHSSGLVEAEDGLLPVLLQEAPRDSLRAEAGGFGRPAGH
jgi:hypothetical protein